MSTAVVARGAPLPRSTALTLGVVSFAGFGAGIMVAPAFFITTVLLLIVLIGAARREIAERPAASYDFLPSATRARVEHAFAEATNGDARALLTGVLERARPIFAARSAQLDLSAERETLDTSASLVDACCATAVELSRVYAAEQSIGASDADAAARARTIRDQLTARLVAAAKALASLYLVEASRNEESSNRIEELTAEINLNASARRAAGDELDALLQGPGAPTR